MATNHPGRSLCLILLCAAALAVAWPAADLFAESKAAVVAARTDGPLYYTPIKAMDHEAGGATLHAGENYRVLEVRGDFAKVKSMRDSRVFWAQAADLAL